MSSNWWAQKLGTPAPAPTYQQPQTFAAPQPATYAQPAQPQYPPTQQMTPQAPRCPGCGSGNYGVVGSVTGMNGTVAAMRCYDCGYPKVQAGTGVGKGIISQGGSSAGPATPARQVPTGTFNGSKPMIGADGGFIQ